MGSMNISIKQEAYDLLNSLKGKDKSFSDVIIEIVNERERNSKDIMKFAGILKEKKADYWSKRKKDYEKIRKELNFELDNRSKDDRT